MTRAIQRTRRLLLTTAALALVGAALGAALVSAAHEHVYNGYSHGLFDGTDSDYFVHPAVHCSGCGSLAPNTIIVSTYREGVGRVARQECSYCFDLHYDFYTAVAECNYAAQVFVRSLVSTHAHYHHYECWDEGELA